MKKYFIMAIAAIATVAFVSCEKKPEPTPDPTPSDAKVVLASKTLELQVAEQGKLRASLDPVKEGVTITFKSENEEIATVDSKGIGTGVASGVANVIASADGYKSDTCVVSVVSAFDAFAWGGLGLFDLGSNPLGEKYTWVSPSGKEYLLQNFVGTYHVWSSDIIFTNNVGFSGAGYITTVKCPVALIQEGSPNGTPGYYVAADLTFDNSAPADSMGVVAEGSLTNPDAWHSYLFDSTYVGDGSFKGVALHYVDFDVDDNSLDFVGFIKNGWIGEYTNGLFYQMNITWFDLEEGIYGLKMEQNTEGKWQFVQPYTFTAFYTQYYEQMPEQEESMSLPKPMFNLNNPVQKSMLSERRISNTKLYKAN